MLLLCMKQSDHEQVVDRSQDESVLKYKLCLQFKMNCYNILRNNLYCFYGRIMSTTVSHRHFQCHEAQMPLYNTYVIFSSDQCVTNNILIN